MTGILTTDDVQLTTLGGGGTLGLDAAVDLGAGNLGLSSGAATADDIALVAGGLQLSGAGPYLLTNVGNNVSTLAANVDSTISYTDADALQVGVVAVLGNAFSGIRTTGDDVQLTTLGGGGTLGVNAAVAPGRR